MDPLGYGKVHLNNRKCIEGGIISRFTLPSKVHASQDSTKTCSTKSVQRVFLGGLRADNHSLTDAGFFSLQLNEA